jgi:hypothetical protein
MRRGQSAPAVRALPAPLGAIQCPFPLDIVMYCGQGDSGADSALFYLTSTIASSPSSSGKTRRDNWTRASDVSQNERWGSLVTRREMNKDVLSGKTTFRLVSLWPSFSFFPFV